MDEHPAPKPPSPETLSPKASSAPPRREEPEHPRSGSEASALAALAAHLDLPADLELLGQALTHPSHAHERRGTADNQRLEFLGDAVLGLCAAELLYQRFPEADEGTLTRWRAQLVNADALAAWAREAGVPASLRLGRGADADGLREGRNVLADAVEALIAVAWQHGGLPLARRACARILEAELERLGSTVPTDPKSRLLEHAQARCRLAPAYRVVEASGPDHQRWYAVEVEVGGVVLGRGEGSARRLAERAAAEAALARPELDETLDALDARAPAVERPSEELRA